MRNFVIIGALFLAACGPKSTPVTPAPASAEQQSQLQSGIVGRWKCTHTKVEAGEKKEQPSDVVFTFKADGTYRLQIDAGIVSVDKTYNYALDGRNVTTSSPHGTYRIDDLSNAKLDLFNYDATTVWYLARQ